MGGDGVRTPLLPRRLSLLVVFVSSLSVFVSPGGAVRTSGSPKDLSVEKNESRSWQEEDNGPTAVPRVLRDVENQCSDICSRWGPFFDAMAKRSQLILEKPDLGVALGNLHQFFSGGKSSWAAGAGLLKDVSQKCRLALASKKASPFSDQQQGQGGDVFLEAEEAADEETEKVFNIRSEEDTEKWSNEGLWRLAKACERALADLERFQQAAADWIDELQFSLVGSQLKDDVKRRVERTINALQFMVKPPRLILMASL